MADVFLSYSSDDREHVTPLVDALERIGLSVWWDRAIGVGTTYDREIEQQLSDARCVLVVWSKHSVDSDWVRNEAQDGLDRSVLIPVRIDDVKPPLAFRRAQTADLLNWPQSRVGLDAVLASAKAVAGGDAPQPRRSVAPAAGTRPASANLWLFAAMAVVAVIAVVTALRWPQSPEPANAVPVVRIDPFEALGAPAYEQYAMVATSDVRTALAGRSVRLVAGGGAEVQNSDYVFKGLVRPAGEAIAVALEFSRARDSEVIWATTLDPTSVDVWRAGFPQATLVALMVERRAFAAHERRALLAQGKIDPRAVQYLFEATEEIAEIELELGGDWGVTRDLLARAREAEPEWPVPHGLLISVYVARAGDTMPAAEARSKAHETLEALKSLIPPGDFALFQGIVDLHLDLDYPGAEENFARASAPRGVVPLNQCWNRFAQGDLGAAIRHCESAASTLGDPGSLSVLGLTLLQAERYGDAREALTQALIRAGGAGQSITLVLKAYAEVFDGDAEAAQATLSRAWGLYGEKIPSLFIGPYALIGDTDKARQILNQSLRRERSGTRGLAGLASLALGSYYLGDLDRAFEFIDKGIDNRELTLVGTLRNEPSLERLRADPRFAAAMSRLRAIEQAAAFDGGR